MTYVALTALLGYAPTIPVHKRQGKTRVVDVYLPEYLPPVIFEYYAHPRFDNRKDTYEVTIVTGVPVEKLWDLADPKSKIVAGSGKNDDPGPDL